MDPEVRAWRVKVRARSKDERQDRSAAARRAMGPATPASVG